MEFVVYCSRALVAPGSTEVEDIIAASLCNNARIGLTSFLYHEPGLFVQYAEGPAEALREAWQRIRTDSRHADAQLIGSGPLARRFFAGWRMGYSDGGAGRFLDFLDEAAGKSCVVDASAREAIWFLRGACQRQDLGLAC